MKNRSSLAWALVVLAAVFVTHWSTRQADAGRLQVMSAQLASAVREGSDQRAVADEAYRQVGELRDDLSRATESGDNSPASFGHRLASAP
jgi:hypothetical protein